MRLSINFNLLTICNYYDNDGCECEELQSAEKLKHYDRLALKWHTPITRSGDRVLGCPLLEKCGIGKPILHA